MEIYSYVIYGLIIGWVIFSIYHMYRANKNVDSINSYIYDSIPTVFTTLGVLGTFVGIYFGLRNFDVNNIDTSIPSLLEGLKTAFLTSIWGVSLSLVFGKVSQLVLSQAESKQHQDSDDELSALNEMISILKNTNKDSNKNFQELHKALIGETEISVTTQIVKLRNIFSELDKNQKEDKKLLEKIQLALGGDDETSLLIQLQRLRAEQNEYSKETRQNIEWIIDSMSKNNEIIRKKFDDFSELLAKNNTEALVEVMKRTTEQFNAQMSALIERLVQENFKELNKSVQQMNQWQTENKEMISKLTLQFESVSKDFQTSSSALKEITLNTNKLTNDNSILSHLIKELQKVMIEDTKYQEIVNKLSVTIETLKENTETFDTTTNKLNNWIRNQMNFSDSVAKLLVRLEEIEKIKDINDIFWKNTKKQLNDGVGLIEKASKNLSNDLEKINSEFYERLNDTLQNLDTLIQRIIENYKR